MGVLAVDGLFDESGVAREKHLLYKADPVLQRELQGLKNIETK